jgi:hypothetical protein
MLKSKMREGITKQIEIDEEDPSIVKAVRTFICIFIYLFYILKREVSRI